jgi:hypothetical protein
MALKILAYRATAINRADQREYRSLNRIALAKGSEKRAFLTTDGTRSLFARSKLETEIEPQWDMAMLDLLLNHSPVFVGGELMLALSVGLFGVALAGTVRERYSIRIPITRAKDRSARRPRTSHSAL